MLEVWSKSMHSGWPKQDLCVRNIRFAVGVDVLDILSGK